MSGETRLRFLFAFMLCLPPAPLPLVANLVLHCRSTHPFIFSDLLCAFFFPPLWFLFVPLPLPILTEERPWLLRCARSLLSLAMVPAARPAFSSSSQRTSSPRCVVLQAELRDMSVQSKIADNGVQGTDTGEACLLAHAPFVDGTTRSLAVDSFCALLVLVFLSLSF